MNSEGSINVNRAVGNLKARRKKSSKRKKNLPGALPRGNRGVRSMDLKFFSRNGQQMEHPGLTDPVVTLTRGHSGDIIYFPDDLVENLGGAEKIQSSTKFILALGDDGDTMYLVPTPTKAKGGMKLYSPPLGTTVSRYHLRPAKGIHFPIGVGSFIWNPATMRLASGETAPVIRCRRVDPISRNRNTI